LVKFAIHLAPANVELTLEDSESIQILNFKLAHWQAEMFEAMRRSGFQRKYHLLLKVGGCAIQSGGKQEMLAGMLVFMLAAILKRCAGIGFFM
jgi:hypothetical protein